MRRPMLSSARSYSRIMRARYAKRYAGSWLWLAGDHHWPMDFANTDRFSQIASCQSLSGTGALHLAGLLLRACRETLPKVYIPAPTWSNHHQVFSSLGFPCESFQYYDPATRDLDVESYYSMLRRAEPNSVVILHACAHNPTGCDPSREQWREIARLMKERRLFPLFDAAYLGFNSGNFDEDAFAIRLFIGEMGMEAGVCVSFAKNMGLYGRRGPLP